jgi:hypothetical protein
MAATDDAKQGKESKNSESRREAAQAPSLEQPGLYWAVGPQPRRVRRR